jgi:HK97 gp10 family phage protein
MRVKVEYMDRNLRNKLANMGREVYPMIADALDFGADIVYNDAQLKVRRRSGNLATSIKKAPPKYYKREIFVTVGTDLEYAPYIEFGTGIYAEKGDGRKTPWVYEDAAGEIHWTVGARPHPYLRPAFDENTEAIKSEVIDALKALMNV